MRAPLAIAVLCSLLSCHQESTAPQAPTAEEMRQIEQETHLKFPPSHRVLMWEAGGRQDAYVRMKLEIATTDWPAFIAASPFRDQPLREDARGFLGTDQGDWDPGHVAHLLKGQVELPDARFLNVGADTSRPSVVVLYLFWFET
jgi:hypothetical protein